MRSSSYRVTFLHPFSLTGFENELPAGIYEVLVQDELLTGHGFETYQRSATYMSIPGRDIRAGWLELHPVDERTLKEVLSHDQGLTEKIEQSEAALSPQEDLK